VAALLLGRALRNGRIAVAGVGAALALSIAGLAVMEREDRWAPQAPDVRVPASIAPLLHTLDRLRVDRAFANYWLAYRITFATNERIVAAPSGRLALLPSGLVTEVDTETSRYPPYERLVHSRRRVAHIYLAGSSSEGADRSVLEQAGYRRLTVDRFVVYVPPERGS